MVLKRVPSFSSRPDFPRGLKVLLLEPDAKHREHVASLLQQCSYQVCSCATTHELLQKLRSAEVYDVLLSELKTLNDKSTSSTVQESLKSAPLVLMSDSPSTEDIMFGVKLGAVEVLEKPLSQTKLRTLWQHTVRKMMSSLSFLPSANSDTNLAVAVAELDEPGTPSPARSGLSNTCSGRATTEGDTEHSSLSHVADPMDFTAADHLPALPTLARTASITSSRCSSPDLRKRKSFDGLANPKHKFTCKDAPLPAPPAAMAAHAAPLQQPALAHPAATQADDAAKFAAAQQQQQQQAAAAQQQQQQQGGMPPPMMPLPPHMPGMMPMMPNGFRPPMPGPLPPGQVWGLPMPPPGLMFPPGFIPPPFPAGFPIPPMMPPCFPMCGAPVPTSCPTSCPSAAPPTSCMLPSPLLPFPTMPASAAAAPSSFPPLSSASSSPTSSAFACPSFPPSSPSSTPRLHPSPSLLSLDVADDDDDMPGHGLGPVPCEMTADSLCGDLPHLSDCGSDNPALLFSDWLLEDTEADAADGTILGLQLKKSDSLVDLINDSLCSSITV